MNWNFQYLAGSMIENSPTFTVNIFNFQGIAGNMLKIRDLVKIMPMTGRKIGDLKLPAGCENFKILPARSIQRVVKLSN